MNKSYYSILGVIFTLIALVVFQIYLNGTNEIAPIVSSTTNESAHTNNEDFFKPTNEHENVDASQPVNLIQDLQHDEEPSKKVEPTPNIETLKEIPTTKKAPTQVTSNINPPVPVPSATQDKSEIDQYDVDLYTLKQGVTEVQKFVPEEIKIVYTRTDNIIERKVTKVDMYGTGTDTVSIDLDSKDNLTAAIKEMKGQMLTDCKNVTTKECTDIETAIERLEKICMPLIKNEDIGMCLLAVFMSIAIGEESAGWSIGY